MNTEILHEGDIFRAADLLRGGELVAFPTETVYGLGAPVFDEEAISKVFSVKGRPQDNPLIAHVAGLQQAERLARDLPERFYRLAEAFWPGPLTLVVKKQQGVPFSVTAGLETIAIRKPDHPVALALIEALGSPLVAPSANLSGRPSCTSAEHVLSDFLGKIAGVIDGGPCQVGIESTVLDLVSFERPTLLRPGSVEKGAIEELLGESIDTYSRGPKSSPGMRYRHYSPDIPVFRFFDAAYPKRSKRSFLITGEDLEASKLYSLLRKAETEQYDEVVIVTPYPLSEGMENRLEKICESHRY